MLEQTDGPSRLVTIEQLFEDGASARRFRWDKANILYREARVRVVDIPAARAALAEAGLFVPDLDAMADALACGCYPQARFADRGFAVAVGAGCGAAAFTGGAAPALLVPGHTGLGLVLASIALTLWVVTFVAIGHVVRATKRLQSWAAQDAGQIIVEHSSEVPMPTDAQRLLRRAVDARRAVMDSEVWNSELFDDHRVRMNLDEELDQIYNRLRRLTSATAASMGDRSTRQVQREVIRSTKARVRALEDYQAQVAEADRQYARLKAAEAAEANTDRLTELLASTAPDRSAIAHLTQLSAESQAAAESIRDVLELMAKTVASLSAPSTTEAAHE